MSFSLRFAALLACAFLAAPWASAQAPLQPGTVQPHFTKLSEDTPGLSLAGRGRFGRALARIGDLNDDGVEDLAVGWYPDLYTSSSGSIEGMTGWLTLLFLNADGSVADQILAYQPAEIEAQDQFGHSIAALGDLDGDGVVDLAVGAPGDDDDHSDAGAVYILFLNTDGSVRATQKISDSTGNFGGFLNAGDQFGSSVAALGDLDGDGVVDLAVGGPGDDASSSRRNTGSVWILFLNTDGTVKADRSLGYHAGGLGGVFDGGDIFGSSLAALGDLNGDGVPDLAAGSPGDDDGGSNAGAVWILHLTTSGTVSSSQKIAEGVGGFTGVTDVSDNFGWSLAAVRDLDGDGVTDLAVGAYWDDDHITGYSSDTNHGAIWILFLHADGTVSGHRKISNTQGAFDTRTHVACTDPFECLCEEYLCQGDTFGHGIAVLGDLDGDGNPDLAVGAPGDDDGALDPDPDYPASHNRGAIYLLDLAAALTNTSGPVDESGAPLSEPVAVSPSGGDVHFEASLTNNTGSLLTTEVWLAFRFPDGTTVVKDRAQTVTLAAGAGRTFDGAIQLFEAFPPGRYTLYGYYGIHPNGGTVVMEITIEKAAGRMAARPLTRTEIRALDLDDFVSFEERDIVVNSAPEGMETAPGSTVLGAAYPNPFNPVTVVPFELAEAGPVTLSVFDLLGREVAVLMRGPAEAGRHEVRFDARALPTGTYLVRLATHAGVQTRRITLLR